MSTTVIKSNLLPRTFCTVSFDVIYMFNKVAVIFFRSLQNESDFNCFRYKKEGEIQTVF